MVRRARFVLLMCINCNVETMNESILVYFIVFCCVHLLVSVRVCAFTNRII